MKKLFQGLGVLLMISGILFLLIHSFIVTSVPDESFSRDLLGFPIPHPPVWTSYIPYLGFLIGLIFELFSIHGLVGITIAIVFFWIGGFLMKFGDEKENKTSRKK